MAKALPAVALVGCVVKTNTEAAPTLTVNELLSPSVKPLAVALRVKLPAWSIRKPLPVIVPLPAPVPMS